MKSAATDSDLAFKDCFLTSLTLNGDAGTEGGRIKFSATFQTGTQLGSGVLTNASFAADTAAGGTCTTSILNNPFLMYSNNAFNGGWTADVYVTYAYTKVL